ncbi:flagellar export chaperone FlgN [Thalassotalea sp. LPB0316]|uniref:flagellar export chaperone FlgN n=1 Tax=Thalassotalea sp. LPB0316 TaxID=2769490 RepID=UPI0018667A96|nr:flagellar export chaperone FlgN [Thalassotalea sp. LPB0316]QOL27056.1 flagellar export chaperone FlgN [Thalassotalea sp. LPB0316]
MPAPLTVKQLIEHQEASLLALEKLLLQEKDILTKQDPQALVAITEEKQTLLQAIEQGDKSLSLHPHFKRDLENEENAQLLVQAREILERCKTLNQVNGQVIAQSEVAVERMRSSLLEKNSKSTMTYDAKGKKSGGLSRMGIKA